MNEINEAFEAYKSALVENKTNFDNVTEKDWFSAGYITRDPEVEKLTEEKSILLSGVSEKNAENKKNGEIIADQKEKLSRLSADYADCVVKIAELEKQLNEQKTDNTKKIISFEARAKSLENVMGKIIEQSDREGVLTPSWIKEVTKNVLAG